MSLCVGFNVFSGLELLKPSINNAREFADSIVVVYQTVSNTGNKCQPYMMDLLSDLKKDGLIDVLINHEPDLKSLTPNKVQVNNAKKRNAVRSVCLKKNIDYFMCKDCDEFYKKDQFEKAFNFIKKGGYDCSLSKLIEYQYKPIYQNRSLSGTLAPFILKSTVPFTLNCKMKYRVDPARRFIGKKFYLFPDKDLLMHHMTVVRYDTSELSHKYMNHSWYDKGKYIKQQMSNFTKIDPNQFKILEEDSFGILDYWENEFCKYKNIQS